MEFRVAREKSEKLPLKSRAPKIYKYRKKFQFYHHNSSLFRAAVQRVLFQLHSLKKIPSVTLKLPKDYWGRISVSIRRSCLKGTRISIGYPWGVSSWMVPLVPEARNPLLAYSNILTRLLNTQWWVWGWWLKSGREPTVDLSLPDTPCGTSYPWRSLLARNLPTGKKHTALLKNTNNTDHPLVGIFYTIVFFQGRELHQL